MGIWDQFVTPEPIFSGLVLNHQGLVELELKNHPKTAVFDQIWLFLSGFLVQLPLIEILTGNLEFASQTFEKEKMIMQSIKKYYIPFSILHPKNL